MLHTINAKGMFKSSFAKGVSEEVPRILSKLGTPSEASYDSYILCCSEGSNGELDEQRILIIQTIRDFDLYGLYPIGTRNPLGATLEERLTEDNKALLERHLSELERRHFHPNSIKRERKAVISFLSYAQRRNLEIGDMEERDLWRFFYDPHTGHRQSSHTVCTYIRRFYNFCHASTGDRRYMTAGAGVPQLVEVRPIYPRLTKEEYA